MREEEVKTMRTNERWRGGKRREGMMEGIMEEKKERRIKGWRDDGNMWIVNGGKGEERYR